MCWIGKPEIPAAAGSCMFHLTLFQSPSINVHQGAWGIISEFSSNFVNCSFCSDGRCTGGLNLGFLAVIYWRPRLKFQSQTSEIAAAHREMWAMDSHGTMKSDLSCITCLSVQKGSAMLFNCPLARNHFTCLYPLSLADSLDHIPSDAFRRYI